MSGRMTVRYCGCGDDWAVVDPDHVPTPEDDGVYAHGFETENKAWEFIHEMCMRKAWKVEHTPDANPFAPGGQNASQLVSTASSRLAITENSLDESKGQNAAGRRGGTALPSQNQ